MKIQALLLLLTAPFLPSCETSASYKQYQEGFKPTRASVFKLEREVFNKVYKTEAYEVEKRDVGRKVMSFHSNSVNRSDLPVSVQTCYGSYHNSHTKVEKKSMILKHARRSNSDYFTFFTTKHTTEWSAFRITDADAGFRCGQGGVVTGFSTQAAAESGLQIGDKIMKYNDVIFASLDLDKRQALMLDLKPGDLVKLEVKRGGWEKMVFEFPAGENEPTHLTTAETEVF